MEDNEVGENAQIWGNSDVANGTQTRKKFNNKNIIYVNNDRKNDILNNYNKRYI